MIPKNNDRLGIKLLAINDKQKEIIKVIITIVIIHFHCTFSFFIFSFFLVCSTKFSNSPFS